jgi:hypothetical protein
LLQVTVLLEFYCNTNANRSERKPIMSGIVSNTEHRLKLVYHQQDLSDADIAHRYADVAHRYADIAHRYAHNCHKYRPVHVWPHNEL